VGNIFLFTIKPKYHNPMKRTIITSLFILFAVIGFAQEKATPYNPNADAKADFKNAIAKAKSENKHVLIQVGGNWCSWCIKFHKFATADTKIDSIIKADYIYILLNYSKENKNLDILKTLQNPQRFGFPVFEFSMETGYCFTHRILVCWSWTRGMIQEKQPPS